MDQELKNRALVEENRILKEQLEQLQQLLDSAPIALALVDKKGKVRFSNLANAQLFGYSKESLLGSDVKKGFLASTFPETMLNNILLGEQHLESYPCVIKGKDLKEKYVELSVSPVFVDNQIYGFVGAMVDVTEKRATKEKIRHSHKELVAMKKISDQVNECLDLNQILHNALLEVINLMQFNAGAVAVVDSLRKKLHVPISKGLTQEQLHKIEEKNPGIEYLDWLASLSVPLVTTNAYRDTRLKKCAFKEIGYATVVTIPLKSKHTIWGSLNIFSEKKKEVTADDYHLLMAIGQMVGVAIENNQLYESERQKRKMTESLIEIANSISSSLKYEEVLDNILNLLHRVLLFDAAAIIRHSDKKVSVLSTSGKNEDINYLLECFNKLATKPTAGLYYFNGYPEKTIKTPHHLKSILYTPLLVKGNARGMLIVGKNEPGFYVEVDIQTLATFGIQVAIAIENALLYEQIERDLKLREELLREMHHRTRNNLELVFGLLSMECMKYPVDNPLRYSLQRVIDRMESVIKVHNLFTLNGENMIEIDGEQLVEASMEMASRFAVDLNKDITINKNLTGNLKLPNKQALIMALILNELLINAVSHAFPGTNGGHITIDFSKRNNQILLAVKDSGQGFPQNFSINENANLGLKIIRNLVERELKGEFEILRHSGTQLSVSYCLDGDQE